MTRPSVSNGLTLLAHLWLHEPGAETIRLATTDLGLPSATPDELAQAYADVLLLNVYPYGSTFLDDGAELNGLAAQQVAALYEAHGYCPLELTEVGSADHFGLCLGFLTSSGQEAILPSLLEWAPVCCLAVEREPGAHPFYRALAIQTREVLFQSISTSPHWFEAPRVDHRQLPVAWADADAELTLRDLLAFFLAPARCGLFLSRSRLGQMAKGLGRRLPFGSRFEVAETLFVSAGESEQVGQLLDMLEAEAESWAAAYRSWAGQWPQAELWLRRTTATACTLAELRQTAVRLNL